MIFFCHGVTFQKGGVGLQEGCQRCCEGKEKTFHALIFCDAAVRIWSNSVFWDRLNSFRGDRMDYLLLALFEVERREIFEVFLMVLWFVWKGRKQFTHGERLKEASDG